MVNKGCRLSPSAWLRFLCSRRCCALCLRINCTLCLRRRCALCLRLRRALRLAFVRPVFAHPTVHLLKQPNETKLEQILVAWAANESGGQSPQSTQPPPWSWCRYPKWLTVASGTKEYRNQRLEQGQISALQWCSSTPSNAFAAISHLLHSSSCNIRATPLRIVSIGHPYVSRQRYLGLG